MSEKRLRLLTSFIGDITVFVYLTLFACFTGDLMVCDDVYIFDK